MSFRKPKLRIGLDIGGHTVKLVAINLRNNSVYACRQEPLVNDEMARTPEDVGDGHIRVALRKILKDLPYRRTPVRLVMSTPHNNVFILTIPEVDDAQIKQTIFWELGPLLPQATQNYEIDYRVLRRERKKRSLVVLVGTLLQSRFEMTMSAIKNFISEVPLLDLESLVILERFRDDFPDLESPAGLLHLGATHTLYTVVMPDTDPAFLVLPFGGDLLNGIIVRNRGVPFLTAEQQRKDPTFAEGILSQQESGEKEAREIWQILVQFISTILRFNARYELQAGKTITRIIATGGMANDHLVRHVLDTPDLFLKLPCDYWEPLTGRLPREQIDAGLAHQYGMALEMALRN
ncbi:MAG: hypothetical protein K9N34_08245 [Candidatus Marinimicrobia bacterium]|nr:hypothetical protein [Candidatus Neomarinimicrobiota bacterium]MCF7840685.1 hypothetical protein [Candidatus Neomarinimicrobiota bacterium]